MSKKKYMHPCEPPTQQKKHKNWRKCKWQFNTICLAYVDTKALEQGYALYRDRHAVTKDECAARFLPTNDSGGSGEEVFCRRPSVFVEIDSSTNVKRVRNETGDEVIDYQETLFDQPTIGMMQRPEDDEVY